MKFLNFSKEGDKGSPREVVPTPGQSGGATAVPAPTEPVAAPETAPATPGPQVAAIDASVREMGEKLTKLSSSMESIFNDRQSFEDKILRMEDRLRKLSSLTEMVSAQFNPFLGDAPPQSTPLRAPEAVASAPAAIEMPAFAPPSAAPPPPPAAPAQPPAPLATPHEEETLTMPAFDAATFPPVPDDDHAERDAHEPAAETRAQLENVVPNFTNSLLLLNWADTLLKAAKSREGLEDLTQYYREIGWISESVRGELLSYAQGLAFAASPATSGGPPDWRTSVEVHERTLLFIEKLRAKHPGA